MSHPPDLVAQAWFTAAKRWLATGFHVHQKFTCSKCGARNTMNLGNRFYTKGVCQDCGATTDIKAAGLLTSNKPCITLEDRLPTGLHPLLYVVSDQELPPE